MAGTVLFSPLMVDRASSSLAPGMSTPNLFTTPSMRPPPSPYQAFHSAAPISSSANMLPLMSTAYDWEMQPLTYPDSFMSTPSLPPPDNDNDDEDDDDKDGDDGNEDEKAASSSSSSSRTKQQRRRRTGVGWKVRKDQDIASVIAMVDQHLSNLRSIWVRAIEDTYRYPNTPIDRLAKHLPMGCDASPTALKQCNDPHVHHTFFDSYCTELREDTFKIADSMQRKGLSLIWPLRNRIVGNRKRKFGGKIDYRKAPLSAAQIALVAAAAGSSSSSSDTATTTDTSVTSTNGTISNRAGPGKGACVPNSFVAVLGSNNRNSARPRSATSTSSTTPTFVPLSPIVSAGTNQVYERAKLQLVRHSPPPPPPSPSFLTAKKTTAVTKASTTTTSTAAPRGPGFQYPGIIAASSIAPAPPPPSANPRSSIGRYLAPKLLPHVPRFA
jgi:hypothetical protein